MTNFGTQLVQKNAQIIVKTMQILHQILYNFWWKTHLKLTQFLVVSLTLNGDFTLVFTRVQSQKTTQIYIKFW